MTTSHEPTMTTTMNPDETAPTAHLHHLIITRASQILTEGFHVNPEVVAGHLDPVDMADIIAGGGDVALLDHIILASRVKSTQASLDAIMECLVADMVEVHTHDAALTAATDGLIQAKVAHDTSGIEHLTAVVSRAQSQGYSARQSFGTRTAILGTITGDTTITHELICEALHRAAATNTSTTSTDTKEL